jgi:hypothetical protein
MGVFDLEAGSFRLRPTSLFKPCRGYGETSTKLEERSRADPAPAACVSIAY